MNNILTKSNPNRYVLFPIEHNSVWKLYKQAISVFWTPEEIDFKKDLNDWENNLNEDERHFIKNILAFFAGSDGIVLENLAERFMKEIEIPEVRCFYGFQIAIENIHSETYSLLIETYIKDLDEKARLFDAINTIPCVTKKANWAIKWINDQESTLATRLIAFAVVEGIFFSGSFCAIYWIKKRGLMPGLTFSNELISRDENLHCEFAILLYSMIPDEEKLTTENIHGIFEDAVNIEKEFILESLPCSLIGMNNSMMSEYIEFIANFWLTKLGYSKLYPNATNPFDFMELISLSAKTNFFENRVSSYVKAGVGKSDEENSFKQIEDF
jgi:ribonucleoside-diphosphate reductase beta chain